MSPINLETCACLVMSNLPAKDPQDYPSFVLLGIDNHYSYQVTRALLSQEYRPRSLILAESAPSMSTDSKPFADIEIRVNATTRESLPSLCAQHRLACHHAVNKALPRLLTELEVDFLLVACWPQKLPPAVIHAVNCAALNLHPSLLPHYRGLDPVADQLNAGESRFGVSLHLISDEIDVGDIILQRGFELQAPPTRQTIELTAAINGAELFIRALRSYRQPGWLPLAQQGLAGG